MDYSIGTLNVIVSYGCRLLYS